MYKQNLIMSIITCVFGVLVGLLLCFTDAEDFLRFVFAFISIYLLLISIPNLVFVNRIENKQEKIKVMVISIATIVVAAILLIYPKTVATIIAGGLLIVLPIYNIIVSKNKKEAFKKELLKLILGAVLVLCGIGSIVETILYILGGAIIALSVFYLVYNIILYIKEERKFKKHQEDNEVIDV